MILRKLERNDVEELRIIHEKFFSKEFPFADLFDKSLSSLVVTDDEEKIITGGQVRVIAESVIITNKDYPIKDKREALQEMLRALMFTANLKGFNQLHAFIQDENWERHLKRYGFKKTKGQALVLNL